MDEAEDLYDEFGNYIGPEIDSDEDGAPQIEDDDEEEEEDEEEQEMTGGGIPGDSPGISGDIKRAKRRQGAA